MSFGTVTPVSTTPGAPSAADFHALDLGAVKARIVDERAQLAAALNDLEELKEMKLAPEDAEYYKNNVANVIHELEETVKNCRATLSALESCAAARQAELAAASDRKLRAADVGPRPSGDVAVTVGAALAAAAVKLETCPGTAAAAFDWPSAAADPSELPPLPPDPPPPLPPPADDAPPASTFVKSRFLSDTPRGRAAIGRRPKTQFRQRGSSSPPATLPGPPGDRSTASPEAGSTASPALADVVQAASSPLASGRPPPNHRAEAPGEAPGGALSGGAGDAAAPRAELSRKASASAERSADAASTRPPRPPVRTQRASPSNAPPAAAPGQGRGVPEIEALACLAGISHAAQEVFIQAVWRVHERDCARINNQLRRARVMSKSIPLRVAARRCCDVFDQGLRTLPKDSDTAANHMADDLDAISVVRDEFKLGWLRNKHVAALLSKSARHASEFERFYKLADQAPDASVARRAEASPRSVLESPQTPTLGRVRDPSPAGPKGSSGAAAARGGGSASTVKREAADRPRSQSDARASRPDGDVAPRYAAASGARRASASPPEASSSARSRSTSAARPSKVADLGISTAFQAASVGKIGLFWHSLWKVQLSDCRRCEKKLTAGYEKASPALSAAIDRHLSYCESSLPRLPNDDRERALTIVHSDLRSIQLLRDELDLGPLALERVVACMETWGKAHFSHKDHKCFDRLFALANWKLAVDKLLDSGSNLRALFDRSRKRGRSRSPPRRRSPSASPPRHEWAGTHGRALGLKRGRPAAAGGRPGSGRLGSPGPEAPRRRRYAASPPRATRPGRAKRRRSRSSSSSRSASHSARRSASPRQPTLPPGLGPDAPVQLDVCSGQDPHSTRSALDGFVARVVDAITNLAASTWWLGPPRSQLDEMLDASFAERFAALRDARSRVQSVATGGKGSLAVLRASAVDPPRREVDVQEAVSVWVAAAAAAAHLPGEAILQVGAQAAQTAFATAARQHIGSAVFSAAQATQLETMVGSAADTAAAPTPIVLINVEQFFDCVKGGLRAVSGVLGRALAADDSPVPLRDDTATRFRSGDLQCVESAVWGVCGSPSCPFHADKLSHAVKRAVRLPSLKAGGGHARHAGGAAEASTSAGGTQRWGDADPPSSAGVDRPLAGEDAGSDVEVVQKSARDQPAAPVSSAPDVPPSSSSSAAVAPWLLPRAPAADVAPHLKLPAISRASVRPVPSAPPHSATLDAFGAVPPDVTPQPALPAAPRQAAVNASNGMHYVEANGVVEIVDSPLSNGSLPAEACEPAPLPAHKVAASLRALPPDIAAQLAQQAAPPPPLPAAVMHEAPAAPQPADVPAAGPSPAAGASEEPATITVSLELFRSLLQGDASVPRDPRRRPSGSGPLDLPNIPGIPGVTAAPFASVVSLPRSLPSDAGPATPIIERPADSVFCTGPLPQLPPGLGPQPTPPPPPPRVQRAAPQYHTSVPDSHREMANGLGIAGVDKRAAKRELVEREARRQVEQAAAKERAKLIKASRQPKAPEMLPRKAPPVWAGGKRPSNAPAAASQARPLMRSGGRGGSRGGRFVLCEPEVLGAPPQKSTSSRTSPQASAESSGNARPARAPPSASPAAATPEAAPARSADSARTAAAATAASVSDHAVDDAAAAVPAAADARQQDSTGSAAVPPAAADPPAPHEPQSAESTPKASSGGVPGAVRLAHGVPAGSDLCAHSLHSPADLPTLAEPPHPDRPVSPGIPSSLRRVMYADPVLCSSAQIPASPKRQPTAAPQPTAPPQPTAAPPAEEVAQRLALVASAPWPDVPALLRERWSSGAEAGGSQSAPLVRAAAAFARLHPESVQDAAAALHDAPEAAQRDDHAGEQGRPPLVGDTAAAVAAQVQVMQGLLERRVALAQKCTGAQMRRLAIDLLGALLRIAWALRPAPDGGDPVAAEELRAAEKALAQRLLDANKAKQTLVRFEALAAPGINAELGRARTAAPEASAGVAASLPSASLLTAAWLTLRYHPDLCAVLWTAAVALQLHQPPPTTGGDPQGRPPPPAALNLTSAAPANADERTALVHLLAYASGQGRGCLQIVDAQGGAKKCTVSAFAVPGLEAAQLAWALTVARCCVHIAAERADVAAVFGGDGTPAASAGDSFLTHARAEMTDLLSRSAEPSGGVDASNALLRTLIQLVRSSYPISRSSGSYGLPGSFDVDGQPAEAATVADLADLVSTAPDAAVQRLQDELGGDTVLAAGQLTALGAGAAALARTQLAEFLGRAVAAWHCATAPADAPAGAAFGAPSPHAAIRSMAQLLPKGIAGEVLVTGGNEDGGNAVLVMWAFWSGVASEFAAQDSMEAALLAMCQCGGHALLVSPADVSDQAALAEALTASVVGAALQNLSDVVRRDDRQAATERAVACRVMRSLLSVLRAG